MTHLFQKIGVNFTKGASFQTNVKIKTFLPYFRSPKRKVKIQILVVVSRVQQETKI